MRYAFLAPPLSQVFKTYLENNPLKCKQRSRLISLKRENNLNEDIPVSLHKPQFNWCFHLEQEIDLLNWTSRLQSVPIDTLSKWVNRSLILVVIVDGVAAIKWKHEKLRYRSKPNKYFSSSSFLSDPTMPFKIPHHYNGHYYSLLLWKSIFISLPCILYSPPTDNACRSNRGWLCIFS